MNKELQDQELDRIGIDLVKTGKLADGQIEKIIASPDMFRAITQRIAANDKPQTPKRRSAWPSNFRLSLAAYGLLAIVVAAAIFESIVERKPSNPSTANVPVHNEPDRIVQPFIVTPSPKEVRSTRYRGESVAQHAVLRSRERTPDRHRKVLTEEVSEFYPLTTSTDDDEDGGQIVRVRLPRAALLSMGVESPFENAPGTKVKTDLLIGSDGVMKAVRFVK
ncbi:MAG: hypothetical protein ABI999_05555 [Acidobacteriota bacterium]